MPYSMACLTAAWLLAAGRIQLPFCFLELKNRPQRPIVRLRARRGDGMSDKAGDAILAQIETRAGRQEITHMKKARSIERAWLH
jgi:hypothetical protein